MNIFEIISLIVLFIIASYLISLVFDLNFGKNKTNLKNTDFEDELKRTKIVLDETIALLNAALEQNKTIISQKKSSETKLGQVAEHLIPFIDGFPYNPSDCKFLGMPIDYVVFDFDAGEITFLEIKTGKARESERQKKIKNMVKTGKVYYKCLRLNEKGLSIKETENTP